MFAATVVSAQNASESKSDETKAKEAADAQKTEWEARAAAYNAQKAMYEAQAAAAKARFGGLEPSGLGGEADISASGAGAAEGMLLGATAVLAIASKFAERINTTPVTCRRLVLADAQVVPSFQMLDAFEAEYDAIARAIKRARDEENEQAIRESRNFVDSVVGDLEQEKGATAKSIALAVAAIPFVSNLLSYAKTDYKFIGIEVTATGPLLSRAIADKLIEAGFQVDMPGEYFPSVDAGAKAIREKLETIDSWTLETKKKVKSYEVEKDVLEKALKQNPDDPDRKRALQAVQASLDTWKAIDEALGTWSKRLSTPDEKGNTPIASLIRQAALKHKLKHAELLVLELFKIAGSGYAKKNLWSSLGVNPFYVMGGAVAGYTLYDGRTGQVLSSQVLPLSGGYHSVSEIEQLVNRN
jgi:tetratricopeptide (TPR) repeat protein